MTDALTDALDALEMMVEQYLTPGYSTDDTIPYEHDFMSAGELALDVLATLRPEAWRLTPAGAIHTPAPTVEPEPPLTPDQERHLTRIMERYGPDAPRPPDADHYKITYRVGDTADVDVEPTISWAVNAVHHWLAMGAQRVEVTRHD
jgi:hypothetical protein